MTSGSWQHISCHWDACSNHSAISDFKCVPSHRERHAAVGSWTFKGYSSNTINTHTNLWARVKWHLQSPDWQPISFVAIMSALVICKQSKSMVLYGTECPYWERASLNSIKLKLKLKHNTMKSTKCYSEVLFLHCLQIFFFFKIAPQSLELT